MIDGCLERFLWLRGVWCVRISGGREEGRVEVIVGGKGYVMYGSVFGVG